MPAKNAESKLNFPKETMLELTQLDTGEIVLRPVSKKNTNENEPENNSQQESETPFNDEPLVTIKFSQQVRDMLGEDAQGIGQHMVHSAIQLLMHQQIASWHANVVDEEPVRYS